jgi:hypothetical protein
MDAKTLQKQVMLQQELLKKQNVELKKLKKRKQPLQQQQQQQQKQEPLSKQPTVSQKIKKAKVDEERALKLKKARDITTRGILDNIFGTKKSTPKLNPNIGDDYDGDNNKNPTQLKNAKTLDQPFYYDAERERNLEAQNLIGPNGEIIAPTTTEKEMVLVERLLDDKDTTIEILTNTTTTNTASMERQYDKTTSIIEKAMTEDRNIFETFTQKMEAVIAEKDKAIQNLVQSTNSSSLELQKQYNASTMSLQSTLNQDREAFTSFTQRATEEKIASDNMIRSVIESFKSTLDSTLSQFHSRELEIVREDGQKRTDALLAEIEVFKREQLAIKAAQDAKIREVESGAYMANLLSHATKFRGTLDEIENKEKEFISKINDHTASIIGLDAKYMQQFQQFENKLRDNESKMVPLNDKLDKLQTEFAAKIGNFNAIVVNLEGANTRIEANNQALVQKFIDLNTRMQNEYGRIDRNASDIVARFITTINHLNQIIDTRGGGGGLGGGGLGGGGLGGLR